MLATQSPFPFYADADGDPLDNGRIYFGVANQNPEIAPIQVYWDSAGSQPAPQPVRTLNGFTVRNGTPAIVYAAVDYSLTVRTKNGELVYHAPTSADYSSASALQAFIDSLANFASSLLGAALAGFNQTLGYINTSVGAKLRDWVSPTDYPWLADKTGASDAVTAINGCYQFCKANGKKMRILNGTYLLGSTSTTFDLPRDDGSFSPTIGGGETALAAEASVTMPVCLVFDGNVEVEGESAEGVILLGNWTHTASPINTAQRIAILQGTNKDSFTQFKLKNLYVKNNMLPLVVQGAASNSEIDIVIDGAGIASCIQSFEGNSRIRGRLIRCYAGHIIGGWWLQRNRTTSATNMPSSFGGSYPASDIFRGCWGENIAMDLLEWTQQPVFDARADSIDTFFSTNFFKPANSAIYPAGRATVNADAGFSASAGYPTYRGVFGIIWAVISRNGRFGSRMKQSQIVSSGHSRASMYVNAGSDISLRQIYMENSALVNPTGGTGAGNIMGTGRADPYRAGAPLSLTLQLDAEGGLGTYQEEIGGFNNAPLVPFIDPARRYNVQIGNRSSAMFELLGGFRTLDTDSPLTRYDEKVFPVDPVISIGGTDQAGWSKDFAAYRRINNTIFFRFSMTKAVPAFAGAGAVTVKNLPFAAIGGGCVQVCYFSNYNVAGYLGAFINGTTIQLNKGNNRATDVANTDLNAGAGVLTVEGHYFI